MCKLIHKVKNYWFINDKASESGSSLLEDDLVSDHTIIVQMII